MHEAHEAISPDLLLVDTTSIDSAPMHGPVCVAVDMYIAILIERQTSLNVNDMRMVCLSQRYH